MQFYFDFNTIERLVVKTDDIYGKVIGDEESLFWFCNVC